MDSKLPELSIFFPFWNEEENVERVVKDAIKHANKIAAKWEIIMVDDGSTDKTAEIAHNLSIKDHRLKLVSLKPNKGYGAALRAGFEKSKYKYIVFTDGDGQFDFTEVSKFIEKIRGADLVIGYRKKRRDNNIIKRLLLMNLLKVWVLLLFRIRFTDIDCGFKMFKKEAIEKLLPLRSEGAIVTTEMLVKARNKKLKIKEVGITHYPRTRGAQSGANIPVVIRAVLESFILWYDLHYGRT